MSGLEIVASIAGVATAAIKISVSMNDVADELGSAGRDVRYISNEMACFSQVLRLVHSSLEDGTKVIGSAIIQSVLNTLPQLIEQCGMVYEEANGLMVSLKPSTGKESLTDSLPFFKRVRFIFQKSRINVLRSLLDSSKSTLNLLLVTLNIEMAKTKTPSKELMDQLQSERKAFIRVVASQSKALNEALGEVEKAKKETTKLRGKVEKEKKDLEKANEKEKDKLKKKDEETSSADSTLKPPSMYMLQAPSVSQLVYNPPQINTASQSAVVSLALSLEPASSTSTYGEHGKLPNLGNQYRPQTSGAYDYYGASPYGASNPPPTSPPYAASYDYTAPPPYTTTEQAPPKPQPQPQARPPPPFEKRVFSDPGPAKPETNDNEHLHARAPFQERSRSPYGFSPKPSEEIPNVKRKAAPKIFVPDPTTVDEGKRQTPEAERGRKPYTYQPYQPPPAPATNQGNAPSPETAKGRNPYTYQPPPPPPTASSSNPPSPETPRARKSSYQAPPPPQPPYTPFTYQSPTEPHNSTPHSPPSADKQYSPYNDARTNNPPPPRRPSNHAPPPPPPPPEHDYFQQPPTPASPPPPPPQHNTTYIALSTYMSREVGHLNLIPFDTLVDVATYSPSPAALPYPTHSDPTPSPVHYWQASLHHRRGPRGLFPHDAVCAIDDERVAERIKQEWFAGDVGLVADGKGRVWVGPRWEWVEPLRRRSKWWAGEF